MRRFIIQAEDLFTFDSLPFNADPGRQVGKRMFILLANHSFGSNVTFKPELYMKLKYIRSCCLLGQDRYLYFL